MPRLALLLSAALLAACAHAPPVVVPDVSAEIAAADRAVEEGCYLCLRDALAGYEAALARVPDHRVAATRAWLVALALVARTRQTGLDDAEALAAVERHGTGAPSAMLPLGDLARLQSRSEPAWDTADVRQVRDRVTAAWAAWQAAGAPAAGPLARAIEIAIRCEYPMFTGTTPDALREAAAAGDPPLLVWARATCRGYDLDPIVGLLERQPRFAEAQYLVGVHELRAGRIDEAARRVAAALDAIPAWPRAAVTLGTIEIAREDFDEAIRRFDEALALLPDHRQALLGKLQALSHAERHAPALAIADRMIALGTWLMGDARYWRAWNLAHLDRYDDAALEVGEAKTLLSNAPIFKLSGIVAFRRGEHAFARDELLEALRLDSADCEIPANLGAVEFALSAWAQAGDRFVGAAACYVKREADVRHEDGARPDDHARVRRRRARDIVTSHRQQGLSFYQAAVALANAGRRPEARAHAEAAAGYEEWAERARALLERLR